MTSDTASQIAHLTRVLKAPTLRDSAERLAERARADRWTHQEYLAACLEAEAATRVAHGAANPDPGRRDPARSRFLASYPARHNQSGCHRCADCCRCFGSASGLLAKSGQQSRQDAGQLRDVSNLV